MTIRNDQYLHGTSAGAGAVAGATGAAHPSNAVQVGGTDGTNLRAFKTEPDGTQHVKAAALEAILGEVVASPTANTVLARLKTLADTLGTEATLALIKTALDTLNAKDFATAAKQDAAKAVLDTIAAKDFATQTTLAAVLAQLDAASSTRASEATLADVKAAVEALAALIGNGALKTALQGHSVPDGQPIPAKLLGTRADTLARRFTGMYRIARVGPLAANTTETVADITDGASYDIEYIEFATNHDSDIRFSIQGYQENGVVAGAMRPITATGSSEIGLSAANVRQHGSAQWELVVDDPEQNRYKLVCKRQVPVGRGFRVQVMNANMTTPYNAGVIIQYNKTAS